MDETGQPAKTCSKCGAAPAGPGGILCGGCKDAITAQLAAAHGEPQPRIDGPQD